jgi:uncharacterized Zn-binding protein involved in type VI secretion
MGQPAAKQDDRILAVDIHIVMIPSPGGPIPTPLPHPFNGVINNGLSQDVKIMGKPAATVDSTADNIPAHLPTPPGTSFQKKPDDKATIKLGSPTVKINGKMAARNGDMAETCNDPVNIPAGQVLALGTVMIG